MSSATGLAVSYGGFAFTHRNGLAKLGPSSKIWKKYCLCLGGQPELIKDALHGQANGFVVPIDGSGILRAA
jgi:hypothetical protein